MMIKMINGASLKVQIFLYYASMAEKSTNKFPYFEQDMTEFNKMGMKKLRKNYEDRKSDEIWSWEEYEKLFSWVATSEADLLSYDHAKKVREELVKEGYLWLKKLSYKFCLRQKYLLRYTLFVH